MLEGKDIRGNRMTWVWLKNGCSIKTEVVEMLPPGEKI